MQDILFTRQFHKADKAGDHYDYRIVLGDKAYSWATKKELPTLESKPILLFEQPIHTADYALSEKVEIPKGQYGAGITTLDWVHKGKAEGIGTDEWKVHLGNRKSYLLKKLPGKYGEKAWLFREIKNMDNKYLEKVAALGKFLKDLSGSTVRHLKVTGKTLDEMNSAAGSLEKVYSKTNREQATNAVKNVREMITRKSDKNTEHLVKALEDSRSARSKVGVGAGVTVGAAVTGYAAKKKLEKKK